MRRLDSQMPSPSEAISSAFLTFVEIVERLAHAHHDDVGDLAPFGRDDRPVGGIAVGEVAEPVARGHQLSEDFFRGEVAHELLRAGVAERAGERAADLAGDAERAAAFLGDVDRLDLDGPTGAARREAEQPLARAVVRHLLLDDLRPPDGEAAVEFGPQILGDVEHVGEVGDAAHVEPVPELLDAHLRLALGHDTGRNQRLGHLGARQADQRRLLRLGGARNEGVAGGRRGQVERDRHDGGYMGVVPGFVERRPIACGAADVTARRAGVSRIAIGPCHDDNGGTRRPSHWPYTRHLQLEIEFSAAVMPFSEKT